MVGEWVSKCRIGTYEEKSGCEECVGEDKEVECASDVEHACY